MSARSLENFGAQATINRIRLCGFTTVKHQRSPESPDFEGLYLDQFARQSSDQNGPTGKGLLSIEQPLYIFFKDVGSMFLEGARKWVLTGF